MAAPLVEELVEAVRALNEIVRRVHAQEELPPFAAIYEAVSVVYRFVKRSLPWIGKAYKLGTGFKGLAAFLERGHLNELDPERLDWIGSRNLPTRDPETAARLMAASARDSERCVKPVYHLSISFDPGDPVNRETMRRVADRTLRSDRWNYGNGFEFSPSPTAVCGGRGRGMGAAVAVAVA